MTEASIRQLQGFGILAGLLVFCLLIGLALYQPVEDARQAVLDARAQIARFEQVLAADGRVERIDTSQVIDQTGSAATALAVQRSVVDLSQASGLNLQQLTTLPVKSLERGIAQHSFGLQLTGDLDQWISLMSQLSQRRPVVFVDNVVLRAGSAQRGDLAMNIQMQLSVYATEAAAK